MIFVFFFLNEPAPTESYTLPLPAALPFGVISSLASPDVCTLKVLFVTPRKAGEPQPIDELPFAIGARLEVRLRSEEHTSELQSRQYLVCRLLLEKKQNTIVTILSHYDTNT